jgi:hypothetical protein
MTQLFADQLRDTRSARRSFAVTRLWIDSVIDLVVTVPGHHLRKERYMTQPVDAGPGATVSGDRLGSASGAKVLLGLLPVWLLVFFQLAAPAFLEPAFDRSVAVMGVPVGLTLLGIVVVLTMVGALAIRRARSTPGVMLAFLCLTTPAAFLLVLTPAVILVLVNARA